MLFDRGEHQPARNLSKEISYVGLDKVPGAGADCSAQRFDRRPDAPIFYAAEASVCVEYVLNVLISLENIEDRALHYSIPNTTDNYRARPFGWAFDENSTLLSESKPIFAQLIRDSEQLSQGLCVKL